MRPSTQAVRLINQQIDPFSSFKHTLNVLRHNPPHIINFMLSIADCILLATLCRTISNHQFLKRAIEIGSSIWWQRGEVGRLGVVACQKLLLDFD